ncbi:MAG: DMT family transporter [Arenibacterium sp.]
MNPTLQGAFWMIGSIVSFTCMAIAGRAVSEALDTFEIMTFRSLIGLVIVVILLTLTRSWQDINTARLKDHVIRNAAHFAGQNLWFYAIAVAPLAQVFALEFTTPIWVILFSPLLLGEKLTRLRAACAVLGFVGILIVARPNADSINAGVLTAAGAAIFFALTYILTKKLTKTQPISAIMFWLTLIQLVFGIVSASYDGDVTLPGQRELPFVTIIALAGLAAHYCIAKALTVASASVVAPVDFARLPVIAVVGVIVYNEPFDICVIVGATVIFVANYLNILGETRKNRVVTASGL